MTAVGLLGALAADRSATSTASGRDTGEPETAFDEIIVQVRELASGLHPAGREASGPSGEGDLAPTQADARDLAAAAALLGVVDTASAAPEASADPRGVDDASAADGAEAYGTVAAGPTLVAVPFGAAATTTILEAALAPQDAEASASASASAPASASPPAVMGGGLAGGGSSAASAGSAASVASTASIASAAASATVAASAAVGGAAGPQGSSPNAPRVAEESLDAQAVHAGSTQPLRLQTPESAAPGGAGVPRTGESPAPVAGRTVPALPAPVGPTADITASAEAAEDGTAEPVLATGDRAASLPAATAASGSHSAVASAAGVSVIAPSAVAPAAAVAAGDVAPDATRTVAAQVAPAVLSIAQRPAGAHQLTMTVNPDSLGPVTVRAHIGQAGEVQVELIGGTDAGRDALRSIVADLRRDLAAVSPHATLSVSTGVSADPGSGRGGQAGAEAAAGDQGERRDGPPDQRGQRPGSDRGDGLAHTIRITTSTRAGVGEGLDTFA